MSREERRRFEREFKKLPKGDTCNLCGKEFPFNSRTFGGIATDGKVAMAGECCAHRLTVMVSGLYVKPIDILISSRRSTNQKSTLSPLNVGEVLAGIQSVVSEVDGRADALIRKAGVSKSSSGVFVGEHSWKADDAAWFKTHPERSHRLRPVLQGEAEAMPVRIPSSQVPKGYRVDVLVRQVEPGKRIRTLFCRSAEIDIPDEEAIIHAIFDTVASAEPGVHIDVAAIIERAHQYMNIRAQRLN